MSIDASFAMPYTFEPVRRENTSQVQLRAIVARNQEIMWILHCTGRSCLSLSVGVFYLAKVKHFLKFELYASMMNWMVKNCRAMALNFKQGSETSVFFCGLVDSLELLLSSQSALGPGAARHQVLFTMGKVSSQQTLG